MQETEIEELKRSSLIMFIGLDSLYNLHAEVELEGNDGAVAACAHCSALADGVIAYPCPSVEILMMDPLSELEETISEISEPAEAEQPSS
jgi:hypothetical protein